jgi:hypothetical protein
LGISLDSPKGRSAWLAAIKKDNLSLPQVCDIPDPSRSIAGMYDIEAIPNNILIGPDGTILARNINYEDLAKIIDVH